MNKHEVVSIGEVGAIKENMPRLLAVLLLGVALGLSACGNKDKKSGQSLVRVNGTEITVLQLNDELKRAGVNPGQQEEAAKQMLESLIDRQLLLDEAMRNEINRTTEVVQAIEHAKTQIITQAYLQSIGGKVAEPSLIEIDEYYRNHPEYFGERKQFDVEQIVIATKDFGKDLRKVVDSAKALDSIISWLDGHEVRYVRGQLSRSTTDLPEHIVLKLKEMHKGQIFIVNEGESSMINLVVDIKTNPLPPKTAEPQIRQYLFNKKVREMAEAEIRHLRGAAKVEYIGGIELAASKAGPVAGR